LCLIKTQPIHTKEVQVRLLPPSHIRENFDFN